METSFFCPTPRSEPGKDERWGGGFVLRSMEVGVTLRICPCFLLHPNVNHGVSMVSLSCRGPFILGRLGVLSTRIKAQKKQLVTAVKLAFCASGHSLQWQRAVTPQAMLKEGRVV